MKNLATKPVISRALTLLLLGLIAIQPFAVTWSAFAKPSQTVSDAIKGLPSGPSIQWWLFCWYYYSDEADKTSEVSDMQACQFQDSLFAGMFTTDQDFSDVMKWPDMRFDQLKITGLTKKSDFAKALKGAFKNQDILTDNALVPDLIDYVKSDAINDISLHDSSMQMEGGKFPVSVEDAFNVFCQQEQVNGIITDTDVSTCKKLAATFGDDQNQDTLFSMFETDSMSESSDVMNAWLMGTSLQVLALGPDPAVQESDWMSQLLSVVNDDSLTTLINKQSFVDDLWRWAPVPLLGGNMGG